MNTRSHGTSTRSNTTTASISSNRVARGLSKLLPWAKAWRLMKRRPGESAGIAKLMQVAALLQVGARAGQQELRAHALAGAGRGGQREIRVAGVVLQVVETPDLAGPAPGGGVLGDVFDAVPAHPYLGAVRSNAFQ